MLNCCPSCILWYSVYSMQKHKQKRQSKQVKRRVAIGLAGIVVVAGVVAVLELTNTTHFFHARPAVSSTIKTVAPPTTSTSPSKDKTSPGTTPQSATTPPTSTTQKPSPTAPSNATLIAPYGTFVSNHHPNLSGSPAPSSEQSTCTTTPGAICTITITNGSVTKTLAAQTVDSSGTTYWNWDVKQSGFTAGTWHITATATLANQTKSTPDTLTLEVQP